MDMDSDSRANGVANVVRRGAVRRATTVAALAAVLLGAWAKGAAADEIYVSIQGQKQGHFPGDATAKQHLG
jgi:hypothetical protein